MMNGDSDMRSSEENLRTKRASYYRDECFDETKTQCEMALEYLQKFESITPIEALNAFGCFRLSARIADLRADGHSITTEIHKGKKNYAIYRLGDETNG